LRGEELQTAGDKNAVGLVRSTGILPHLVNQFVVKPRDRRLRGLISSQGTPLRHFRDLEVLMEECAYAICLESLPAAYMITLPGRSNAFTFGSDDAPVIVVDRRIIEVMGASELRALMGHEMGHVKSGHMLYHTLAEMLARGVEASASLMGFGLISMPTRLALLAWQRESEFSADRAALIASDGPAHVVSMFAKLTGIPYTSMQEDPSLLDDVVNLFRTHPNLSERAKAVFEFSKTPEYANIMNRINDRRMFRLAFSPTCRFCGSRKTIEATFCPVCGKSQV
jgi:Zn-dependent protease with chaperone function